MSTDDMSGDSWADNSLAMRTENSFIAFDDHEDKDGREDEGES